MKTNRDQLRIFGIRHHGPGSARCLLAELTAWQPDAILIEGPADATEHLPLAADPGMQPPVALLVYNPKETKQASFFPFAEFSPEWQAIRFGLAAGCHLELIDLPMAITFALREDDTLVSGAQEDPFAAIALLAGYTDAERWWEAMVERGGMAMEAPGAGPFTVVMELMQALRTSGQRQETRETLLREAWMRQRLRAAQRQGFQRIAVVCGAWHAPVLEDIDQFTASSDAALLRNLKKVKTESTWIPWSFDRLARSSGYGAGVVAPAWYRILWAAPHAPQTVWLTQAAQRLRREGADTSSAHVIEAIRLADTLAALRGTLLPGIDEIREAAVSVLGQGAEHLLDLLEREMVIGDVLGLIPDHMPQAPLRADFEAQAKSCRLVRNTAETALDLDLRKPAHLQKSRFLHRCALLGIPWGKTQETASGKHGAFHENWLLRWQPDYEIRLIEAGAWGNSVEEAVVNVLRQRLQDAVALPELVRLLGDTLKAELPALLPALITALQAASTLAADTLALADTILPMVETLRYGNARRMNMDVLEQLLEQIVPRVCIQLPDACTDINEEFAASVLQRLLAVNRGISLLGNPAFEPDWQQTLKTISTRKGSAPLLSGFATRLLFDKEIYSLEQTGTALQFHLSPGQTALHAANWLEGLLHGNALLLLHHPPLWHLIDDWVGQVPEPTFSEIVPLLRRTFSRFSGPERTKILDMARSGPTLAPPSNAQDGLDATRAQSVLDLLRQILVDEQQLPSEAP